MFVDLLVLTAGAFLLLTLGSLLRRPARLDADTLAVADAVEVIR